MGAGKTTAGALLAHSLRMGFFDIDAQIEAEAGMSITKIFDTFGEDHFRDLEYKMTKKIALLRGYVIATGGGIVLNPHNTALLSKKSIVIYLRANPETIYARLINDDSRPLLRGGGALLAKIQALLAVRENLYIQTADIIIDVDAKKVDELVEECTLNILAGKSCQYRPI